MNIMEKSFRGKAGAVPPDFSRRASAEYSRGQFFGLFTLHAEIGPSGFGDNNAVLS